MARSTVLSFRFGFCFGNGGGGGSSSNGSSSSGGFLSKILDGISSVVNACVNGILSIGSAIGYESDEEAALNNDLNRLATDLGEPNQAIPYDEYTHYSSTTNADMITFSGGAALYVIGGGLFPN